MGSRSPQPRPPRVLRLALPALLLAAAACLASCEQLGVAPAAPTYRPILICPDWPAAGPEVAAELERLPQAEYPATREWLARLTLLRRQLETCATGGPAII